MSKNGTHFCCILKRLIIFDAKKISTNTFYLNSQRTRQNSCKRWYLSMIKIANSNPIHTSFPVHSVLFIWDLHDNYTMLKFGYVIKTYLCDIHILQAKIRALICKISHYKLMTCIRTIIILLNLDANHIKRYYYFFLFFREVLLTCKHLFIINQNILSYTLSKACFK